MTKRLPLPKKQRLQRLQPKTVKTRLKMVMMMGLMERVTTKMTRSLSNQQSQSRRPHLQNPTLLQRARRPHPPLSHPLHQLHQRLQLPSRPTRRQRPRRPETLQMRATMMVLRLEVSRERLLLHLRTDLLRARLGLG